MLLCSFLPKKNKTWPSWHLRKIIANVKLICKVDCYLETAPKTWSGRLYFDWRLKYGEECWKGLYYPWNGETDKGESKTKPVWKMMGQKQTNLRAKINVFLTGSRFDYIIVIINLSSLNQYISQLICKLPFTFSHLVCMSMTNYKAYIYIDIHWYFSFKL